MAELSSRTPDWHSASRFALANARTRAPRSSGFIDVYPTASTDLEAVSHLLTLVFHPPLGFQYLVWPLLELNVRADLKRRFSRPSTHYCCLGAWVDGQLVGTLEVGLRRTSCIGPNGRPRQPYIANLAVLNEWRRQGVAKHLLQAADLLAQSWGYRHLYLHVLESNLNARHLYAALGYEVLGTQSGNWEWLGLSRQLLMRKIL